MRYGLVVLAVVALALPATVNATITWTSATLMTTTVTPPPVVFEQGAGAGNARFVKELEVSPNGTSFTGTIKARAGADVAVQDVVRLHNSGPAATSVTLTGSPETNVELLAFSWTVMNGTASIVTLDHLTAEPLATFTLPAGETYSLDLRIELEEGAGKHTARFDFSLGAEVS